MEICVQTGRSSQDVQLVLARLKKAGVIEFVESDEASSPPGAPVSSDEPPVKKPSGKVKYWRGRPVE